MTGACTRLAFRLQPEPPLPQHVLKAASFSVQLASHIRIVSALVYVQIAQTIKAALESSSAGSHAKSTPLQQSLKRALQAWRKQKAADAGLSVDQVVSDHDVQRIATGAPTSKSGLVALIETTAYTKQVCVCVAASDIGHEAFA